MTDELAFDEKIAQFKAEVNNLEDVTDEVIIEQTAQRLEGLKYAPPVIIAIADFLRLTKETLGKEIDRILALPDQEACALAPNEPKKCQDLRIQFIAVQIYYYKKLVQLRKNDPNAWDELNELYVYD